MVTRQELEKWFPEAPADQINKLVVPKAVDAERLPFNRHRGYPPLQEQMANYVTGGPLPRLAGIAYSPPLQPRPMVVPTSPTPRASSLPPRTPARTTSQVPTQVEKPVPSSFATPEKAPLPQGRDGGEDAPLPEGEGDKKEDEGEENPKDQPCSRGFLDFKAKLQVR